MAHLFAQTTPVKQFTDTVTTIYVHALTHARIAHTDTYTHIETRPLFTYSPQINRQAVC
jgi:hypothetical protein